MNTIDTYDKDEERFSVYQFFPDNSYEVVRSHVPIKAAVDAAWHYTHSVGAVAGITRRVIITDSGDCTCFEWLYGKGVVFPEQPSKSQREYKK